MQNGYIESFNGKFRDDCLNKQWFQSLPQARDCIAEWRKDYNEVRPYSSLGRVPPSKFAQQQRIQIFATDSNNNQFLDKPCKTGLVINQWYVSRGQVT
jgi:putative transposase